MNNHDSNFKQLMANRGFFEAFIKTYLPENILSKMDWNSIKLYKMGGTHVELNTNKEFESDVIYLANIDGKENMLWFHCEHQSTPDRTMPLRVLHYQTAELLSYAKQNPSNERLPAIVSIIYHQGEKPWPYSLSIKDQFVDPALAMEYFGNPLLIDLPAISDEELKKHQNIGPVEIILKHVRQKDFERKLRIMISSLQTVDYNSKEIVLRYILDFIDMPRGEFIKTIGECLPEDMELAMSLSERLLQQGAEARNFEIARSMLAKGLDERLIEELTKLSKADLSNLKKETKH